MFYMVPGKDQIVLQASEAFKDALGAYAQQNETSMAQVIREAVAERMGYDLAADPKIQRAKKYDSPEAQKRAALDRATVLRWARKTIGTLLAQAKIEEATIIAQAIEAKDYESLEALKDAFEQEDEEAESEE